MLKLLFNIVNLIWLIAYAVIIGLSYLIERLTPQHPNIHIYVTIACVIAFIITLWIRLMKPPKIPDGQA